MAVTSGGPKPPKKKPRRRLAERIGVAGYNHMYGRYGSEVPAPLKLFRIYKDNKGNKTVRPSPSPRTRRGGPK